MIGILKYQLRRTVVYFMTRLELLGKLENVYKGNDLFNKIIVFGSTARGDYRSDSDIDIYFESTLPISRLSSSKKYQELEDRVYDIIYDYNSNKKIGGCIEIDSLIINPSEVKSFKKSSIWGSIEKEGIVLWTSSNCNIG